MSMVLARILLRYLAGILAGYGFAVQGFDGFLDDPDVAVVVAAIIAAATEALYALAKRYGYRT